MTTEQEIQAKPSVSQEVDPRLSKPIGNIETEKLEAKDVIVKSVEIRDQNNKDKKKVGEMAHLMCLHPDHEELIDLSKAWTLRNDKVTETGLWYNEDKDGNILKNSALACVLRTFNCANLGELVSKSISTKPNDAGYLGIKAY